MRLSTALFWAGVQTGTRMLFSFASIKVTAVFLGPSGLALVGQLTNFVVLLQGSLGSAIQTGVVKLTAAGAHDRAHLKAVWGTALRLMAGIGVAAALAVAVAAQPLSSWLLGDPQYWPVFVLVGVSMPFVLVNLVLTDALNGLGQIDAIGLAAVMATIGGAVVFIPLCYEFQTWGGLIGVVLAQLAAFLASLIMIKRSALAAPSDFTATRDAAITKTLVAFYPMLLVHSVAEPFSVLLVRENLLSELGGDIAGIWQANLRLSEMYTQVLTTALSLYLMQHLSSIKDGKTFSRELYRNVFVVTALTALGAVAIFASRDLVIALVLTNEFHGVRELLGLQLLGDVLKMAGWPLRMALVITLRTGWYMAVEATLAVTIVCLTRLWLPSHGVGAAPAAHATAWATVLVLLVYAYSARIKIPVNGMEPGNAKN